MMDGIYYIRRHAGTVACTFMASDGANIPIAPPRYHSPTGFEYGYGGSGPADLALAVLAHHFGERWLREGESSPAIIGRWLEKNAPKAMAFHQDFKWHFLGNAMADRPLQIDSDRIARWFDSVLAGPDE